MDLETKEYQKAVLKRLGNISATATMLRFALYVVAGLLILGYVIGAMYQ